MKVIDNELALNLQQIISVSPTSGITEATYNISILFKNGERISVFNKEYAVGKTRMDRIIECMEKL